MLSVFGEIISGRQPDLRFEFAQHHLEEMFNHTFKTAMEKLVHTFTDRAKDLYGK